jgi:hypothetical protein
MKFLAPFATAIALTLSIAAPVRAVSTDLSPEQVDAGESYVKQMLEVEREQEVGDFIRVESRAIRKEVQNYCAMKRNDQSNKWHKTKTLAALKLDAESRYLALRFKDIVAVATEKVCPNLTN